MPHADPEVKRAYNKAYNLQNRGRIREQKRRKRLADPAYQQVLDHAAYLRKDKAKKKLRDHRYYQANKAKESARKHAYYLAHPELFFARTRKRRALKYGAAVNDLTAAQWREIKAAYGYRCVYCGKKPRKLEQEHITPLSKGGMHTASNVVPACLPCNRRKGAGEPLVPVQPLLCTIALPRCA